jgi:hypothetical protein
MALLSVIRRWHFCELIEQGAPAFKAAVPTLSQLLKAEMPNVKSGPSLTRSKRPGSRHTRIWPGSTLHPAK